MHRINAHRNRLIGGPTSFSATARQFRAGLGRNHLTSISGQCLSHPRRHVGDAVTVTNMRWMDDPTWDRARSCHYGVTHDGGLLFTRPILVYNKVRVFAVATATSQQVTVVSSIDYQPGSLRFVQSPCTQRWYHCAASTRLAQTLTQIGVRVSS